VPPGHLRIQERTGLERCLSFTIESKNPRQPVRPDCSSRRLASIPISCIPSDNLVEQGLRIIDERQLTLLEFCEELVPRYLYEVVVLGVRRLAHSQQGDSVVEVYAERDSRSFAYVNIAPTATVQPCDTAAGKSYLRRFRCIALAQLNRQKRLRRCSPAARPALVARTSRAGWAKLPGTAGHAGPALKGSRSHPARAGLVSRSAGTMPPIYI
jgi:hypothetical protein